jgi:uncharacterized membrane protein YbhN (UPF0104 family)
VDSPPAKSRRRWLLLALKLVIVALLLWGIRKTLVVAFDKLAEKRAEQAFHFQPGWLAAAGGLYLLGILPCGLFWRRSLRAVGHPAGWLSTLRAYYIGHLGKYVPGKAMVVVLRTGLIPRAETGATSVVLTVFYETMTMMAVGAVLGAIVLAIGGREHILYATVALLFGIAATVITLPPVFRWFARFTRVDRVGSDTSARLAGLGYSTLLYGWIILPLGWIVTGASLWATLKGCGAESVSLVASWPQYTAAVALATVAGFVLLVPGGAVVREAVLIEITPALLQIDPATALVAAIVWRLVGLLSEVAISVILYPCGARLPGRSAPPPA